MGGGKSEGCSERVHSTEQVDLRREDERGRDDAEDDDRHVWRLELRVQPRERLWEEVVLRKRVAQARDADEPGVGGNDQDREGEDSDPDARPVSKPIDRELGDDSSNRIVFPGYG